MGIYLIREMRIITLHNNKIKDKENYIKCIYQIKNEELNLPLQILNNGEKNEKDIRKYCELYVNNKKINFCLKYQFNKENQNEFKIKVNKFLKNISFLFSFCTPLVSIDLYNFNTNNVNNMKCIFYKCSSLTTLNLSNFNTNNVKDMSWMFSKCSSLSSLNLSNFILIILII